MEICVTGLLFVAFTIWVSNLLLRQSTLEVHTGVGAKVLIPIRIVVALVVPLITILMFALLRKLIVVIYIVTVLFICVACLLTIFMELCRSSLILSSFWPLLLLTTSPQIKTAVKSLVGADFGWHCGGHYMG